MLYSSKELKDLTNSDVRVSSWSISDTLCHIVLQNGLELKAETEIQIYLGIGRVSGATRYYVNNQEVNYWNITKTKLEILF